MLLIVCCAAVAFLKIFVGSIPLFCFFVSFSPLWSKVQADRRSHEYKTFQIAKAGTGE